MGRVKAQLQRRVGHGKSEVTPSLMPRPRKTPEALITTASVKERLLDLSRRRRNSGGHALLMPQAEETIFEAGSTNKHQGVHYRDFETWKAHATKAGYHVSKIKKVNPDEHVHVALKQERLDPQRDLSHVPGQRWRGIFWHNSHVPGLNPSGYLRTKYIPEDAGGLGYAAPDTGNNNYAQSLPAGIGTTNANMAAKTARKKLPKVTQQSDETVGLNGLKEGAFADQQVRHEDDAYELGHQHGYRGQAASPPNHPEQSARYHEGYARGRFDHKEDTINDDVITSLDQLDHLFETYSPGYTLPITIKKNPTSVAGNYRKTMVGKSTAMKGAADDAGILESKITAIQQGALDGLKGNELPKSHIESKFGTHAQHYYDGIEQGKKERKRRHVERYGKSVPFNEELKVGDGVDGPNQNRVKRKYLGTQRGRTATGKRAHPIDVMPVIQKPDKNINKTTPGSPLKRTT